MQEKLDFYPYRRVGLIFQIIAVCLLFIASVLIAWRATYAETLIGLLLFALFSFLVFGIIPLQIYGIYALINAYYRVERDGVRLRWGLRREDIPVTAIRWIYPAENLQGKLPLPRIRWPGAVLGLRRVSKDEKIEFLASETKNLLVIYTDTGAYAISPSEKQAFLQAYQRISELGSLTPLPSRSILISNMFTRVWKSIPARTLLVIGALLSAALLVLVLITASTRVQVHLGFFPDGSPGELFPSVRLILLPIINTALFLADALVGLYFFRREQDEHLSYLLWGAGVFCTIIFLAALFFITQAG